MRFNALRFVVVVDGTSDRPFTRIMDAVDAVPDAPDIGMPEW